LKKLSVLLIVFTLFFAVNSSYSQPQVTIHVTGGYNLPLPDLKGDLLDSADITNTFGMKLGYGFGADGKYYFGKKRNVGITLALGYQLFQNTEDTSKYLGKDITSKLNAFNVGLGVEYAFLPKKKANPFIGAEFTGHFFSGTYEATNVTTQSLDMESASRFGAAIGAGVDIAFNKNIGIVIGAKYHLANLIGKDFDTTAVPTGKFRLYDKEFTAGTTTIDAKNISYIQAYLGVSFFLNQPKKKMK